MIKELEITTHPVANKCVNEGHWRDSDMFISTSRDTGISVSEV